MSAESSRSANVVYYRHDGIVVTSRYFTTDDAHYHVGELSVLTRSESLPHPGVRLGIILAAVGLVIAIPVLLAFHSFVGLAISVPFLLIPCMTSYVCASRWPVEMGLLARYRGRHVVLFTTSDRRRFGQVARALVRALEGFESKRIEHQ